MTIRQLVAIQCSFGDSLAQKLSLHEHSRLASLLIYADPVSNRGIKLLMKLNIPSLKQLELVETQMTTDSLKVLRKGNCRLASASMSYHKGVSCNEMLKGLYRLLTDTVLTNQKLTFLRDPSISIMFEYFAFLAKIEVITVRVNQ